MSDNPPVLVAGTPDNIANNPGAIYDTYKGTDYPYTPDPNTKAADNTNLRTVNAYVAYLDNVFNQGQMGSCVANSTAAMYRFEFRNHIVSASSPDPSRLFIYYNARNLGQIHPIGDNGSQNRDSLHGLNKYGTCGESTWPYVMLRAKNEGESDADYTQYKNQASSQVPSPTAYTEALKHTIQGYYRLDIDRPMDASAQQFAKSDGQHILSNAKLCLSEGHPFIFAFFWAQNKDSGIWAKRPNGDWTLVSSQSIKAKDVAVPTPLYGHSVLGIGYDAQGLLCQNSWGENTASPTFWMPWDWITDFTATNDFWMIKVVGN